ncbi:hypothetical protein HK098_007355 [Nowakowskiella sp. JEL0407]|nr:hypothetical protein HK098_007355 [Nowakowskiella sp. JEL0407]
MGVGIDSHNNRSSLPQILASAISGFLELSIFHPIDTIGKRLINHRGASFSGATTSQSITNLRRIIFRDPNLGFFSSYASLFPGFKFAVLYKVSQRSYQFGGHPILAAYVDKTEYGEYIRNRFGKRKGKTVLHAFCGAIIGIGEVSLLPLDALKVKKQTASKASYTSKIPSQKLSYSTSAQYPTSQSLVSHNSQIPSTASLGLLKTIRALYRGASWTAARNSIGCVALFGAAAAVKDVVFNLDETKTRPTLFQSFCASVAGATASILIASPLDVIKVRVQAAPMDSPVKGVEVLRLLLKHEGVFALYKGIVPKLLVAAPKITFSFTVAQQLGPMFSRYFDKKQSEEVF